MLLLWLNSHTQQNGRSRCAIDYVVYEYISITLYLFILWAVCYYIYYYEEEVIQNAHSPSHISFTFYYSYIKYALFSSAVSFHADAIRCCWTWHTHTHTNTYCVVGNAINWTIIWSIIWRSIERPSSGNDWCGCDNECLRCYDEFFRAFCGPVAKRIFISQSGHCRFIAMLTGAGPDIAGQEYGAHIGHIQCY